MESSPTTSVPLSSPVKVFYDPGSFHRPSVQLALLQAQVLKGKGYLITLHPDPKASSLRIQYGRQILEGPVATDFLNSLFSDK
jgi:hypothetical protein